MSRNEIPHKKVSHKNVQQENIPQKIGGKAHKKLKNPTKKDTTPFVTHATILTINDIIVIDAQLIHDE